MHLLCLQNFHPFNLHCADVASAKTVGSAPGQTVHVTAVSPATLAHSATSCAQLVTMETVAGKSVPAAGIANPVNTKLGSAGAVTQDGRDPGAFQATTFNTDDQLIRTEKPKMSQTLGLK